jgi:phosphatidylglycerol:prolipoprotein diacylglycerol transferase
MFPIIHDFDFFGLLAEPWSLHTYGVLIAAGFIFAMKLGQRQALHEGEDPDRVVDLAFYVLLTGLIGSRIVFILTKLDDYVKNPVEILMFWRGGLVWYGGFIAASLYVVWYCRRYRLNFFKHADLYIPLVALAHGFGRVGCLAAGCCHGKPTDLPWGIVFPNGSMAHAAQQSAGLVAYGDHALPIHPTQLYEAGFEIGMFWLLTMLRPRKRFHGELLLIWLATYPIARSIIEVVRGDKERGVWFLGLSTSQLISIVVAGVAVWVFFHLRKAPPPEATSAA